MRGERVEEHEQRAQGRNRARAAAVVKAFTKIIIWAMAVLKESASMSAVTFLIVAWMTFCCARVGSTSASVAERTNSPAWFSSITSRQTRARNRATPSTPVMLQGFICSSGPINIS